VVPHHASLGAVGETLREGVKEDRVGDIVAKVAHEDVRLPGRVIAVVALERPVKADFLAVQARVVQAAQRLLCADVLRHLHEAIAGAQPQLLVLDDFHLHDGPPPGEDLLQM